MCFLERLFNSFLLPRPGPGDGTCTSCLGGREHSYDFTTCISVRSVAYMFIYFYYITNLELFKTYQIVTIQNVCYLVRVKIYIYGRISVEKYEKRKIN